MATPSSYAVDAKTSYAVDAKTNSKDELCIEHKFEPGLWDKVQTSLSNGTMKDLSLIIRLVRDKRITGMEIEELKNHAVSLFTNNCNATVYSVCDVLPVIMATVSVTEAEKIATYEFVESIGDGDKTGYAGLDISRSAIGADNVETTFGYDGTGITIAILDSGIHNSHPDLNDLDDNPGTTDPKVIRNRSWVDWDDDGIPDVGPEDNLGHGTHVAGIAAGTGEQSGGLYRGIAPGAWLMNVKVCNLTWIAGEPNAEFEHDDVINGIDYAVTQGADVISMSLMSYPGGDGTSELAKAADDAVDQGVHVVVIAGNWADSPRAITTPGDAFNVITVGGVDDNNTVDIQDDRIVWDSSRGPTHEEFSKARPKPDVVAPGEDIIAPVDQGSEYWQTYPDDRVGNFYLRSGGTSTAAPHVSGTVALMLEANSNLTPAQVKAILRQTARLNDNLTGYTVNDRGHGIIDAFAAVQMAQGSPSSIDLSQMYDEFDVETPGRYFGIGESWDRLRFTVSGPSSLSISVIDVEYHHWDWWGASHYYYDLLWRLNARHVWIDGIYYNLGSDMNEYLFSGPRIISKGSGYVYICALYRVNDVSAEYTWLLDVDEMYLWVHYSGGSSYRTLMYIDTRVQDYYDYAYLPSTSEHIYYERTVTGDTLLNVGDLDHSEYIEIDPYISDNPVMWVLRYGYLGNDPDSALNGENVADKDIVVYYQGTSSYPGGWIYRRTSGLPKPRPTLTINAWYGGYTVPSEGEYDWDLGTSVSVYAYANVPDYVFPGYWMLDGSYAGYDNPITIIMDAPHYLEAHFTYTGSSCVAEGTLVTMADGTTKPIEKVKKGDQVLGYDPATSSYMAENVLDTMKHQVEVIVNLNNGMLKLTPLDQPIFIRNSTYEGWMRDPADIQVGWEIYEAKTNGWVPVTSVTYEEGKTRVYDLVLDGYTTYIANGILLMDKGPGC